MCNHVMTRSDWRQITGWLVRMFKYDDPAEHQLVNKGYWGA